MHASEQAADGIAPQEKREKSGERWPLKSLLEYHLRLREHLDGLIQVVNLRLQLLLRLLCAVGFHTKRKLLVPLIGT